MRRSGQLKRKTQLRAKPRPRAPRKPTKYKQRPRDSGYMTWIKSLPCWAQHISPCRGPVEADHAGRRGLGRKCEDIECIPLCSKHHRERTDWAGVFRDWNQTKMRDWLIRAINSHQDVWRNLQGNKSADQLY